MVLFLVSLSSLHEMNGQPYMKLKLNCVKLLKTSLSCTKVYYYGINSIVNISIWWMFINICCILPLLIMCVSNNLSSHKMHMRTDEGCKTMMN